MNRLAAGLLIVLAGLALQAISGKPALATETGPTARPAAAPAPSLPQGNRVLALVLALQALQTAPEGTPRSKV